MKLVIDKHNVCQLHKYLETLSNYKSIYIDFSYHEKHVVIEQGMYSIHNISDFCKLQRQKQYKYNQYLIVILDAMSTNTTVIELHIKQEYICDYIGYYYYKMLSKNYTLETLSTTIYLSDVEIFKYNNTLKELILYNVYGYPFRYYRPLISLESLCYNVIRSHQLPTYSIPKYILDRHKIES